MSDEPGKVVAKPVASHPGKNGGWLRSGGTKSPGRPPNELRRAMRDVVEAGLPALMGFAEGRVPLKLVGICEKCGHEHAGSKMGLKDIIAVAPRGSDMLKAIEVAGRLGLENNADESLVKGLATEVASVLAPLPNGEELLREIMARWMPLLADRV